MISFSSNNDEFAFQENRASMEDTPVTVHYDYHESYLESDMDLTFSSFVLDDDIRILQSCDTLNIDFCPLIRIIRRICQTNLLSGIFI